MSWFPSGLPQPLLQLVRAIEQQFQPKNPNGPVKLPSYTTNELNQQTPTDYAAAINKTTGKLVISVLSGAAFKWQNADGTAL